MWQTLLSIRLCFLSQAHTLLWRTPKGCIGDLRSEVKGAEMQRKRKGRAWELIFYVVC